MAPPPWVSIWLISARRQSHTPLRLTAIMRSKDSSDHSAVFWLIEPTCHPATPALLKAQSRRPYAPTTAAIISRTSASRDTSPDSDIACPPAALTRPTVSRAATSTRSTTATRAPPRAKSSAVTRPIPPPPPVISADFPSSNPAIALLPELSQSDHGTAAAPPGIPRPSEQTHRRSWYYHDCSATVCRPKRAA